MTKPSIKRILIPLGSQRAPAGMLEHAAAIAAKLQSELYGLFIEDSDLLNFAQLPVGREISFSTGRTEPSSMSSMERSLRQIANRSQQELSQLATRYKVQSQFVTRRGHSQQTVQAECQIGDLLILSGIGAQANKALLQQAYDFLHSGHHYLAWLPPQSDNFDGIVVVQDNSPAAEEAMQLAEMLVKDNGHSITTETFTDVAALASKLKTCKKGFWIVPYRQDWDLTVLGPLLGDSRCPVLLVNQ